MKRIYSQKGFSLPEVMLGMGVLSIVALGGMYISKNMKDSQRGIQGMSQLNRAMLEARAALNDPAACWSNFGNKGEGAELTELKNGKGEIVLAPPGEDSSDSSETEQSGEQASSPKIASKTDKRSYDLKKIKIEKLDPIRKRAHISFEFDRAFEDQRAKSLKKFTTMFAKIENGKIVECLNPADQSLSGMLRKLCWDADPWNFDADSSNDNTNCEENLDHLVAEVTEIYCENNPLLTYDPGSKKCVPIDANVTCGTGSFLRGYDAEGKKVCYTPVAAAPVGVTPASVSDACPTVDPESWGGNCSGKLAGVASGSSSTASNTKVGYTGSATYSCSDGAWTQTSQSCDANVAKPCPTVDPQKWGANSSCSGVLDGVDSGSISIASNTASGYDGSATYECNDGSWTYDGGWCSEVSSVGSSSSTGSSGVGGGPGEPVDEVSH